MASSPSSVATPKISVIKRKAGFVIPKNKFSGSLVPLFKGSGNKSETGDAVSEESNKQLQRKTKWAPDLTQDPSVRRGRALAYQTRVDQITQQLKLGSLSGDAQSLKPAGSVTDSDVSTSSIDHEKLQALELERREAIGEILKLNPGYKVPSDYQPVMREATVSVPVVQDHPGCNFLSLLYGPDGDTHRRLEKETGSKIKVFGRKSEPQVKVEIEPSDSREVLISYDEVFVQILAESYEKVDAAASLIELLLSSVVPGKSAAPNASTSDSSGNAQVPSEVQDMAPPVVALSSAMTDQELVQSVMRPVPTSSSSQGSFQQQYPPPWFPANQPNMPSGPASATFTFNPSPMNPAFGPRPMTPYGFGSSPQSIQGAPSRLHPSIQAFPSGQTGPPRNHPGSTFVSPFIGQQPTAAGSPRVPVPHFAERPLTPTTASSPRWAGPPAGGPQPGSAGTLAPPPPPPVVSSQGPHSVASLPARPSGQLVHPQAFPQARPVSFASSQIRSSSAMPAQSFTQLNSSNNAVVLRPSASFGPQSAMPSPAVGASNTPSFTPLNPMGGGAASRPPLLQGQGLSDFTFQPHRPQGHHPQSTPGHGHAVSLTSQRPRPPPPSQLNSPQGDSFRRPNFLRPQMGPPPGQFGPSNPSRPNIGPRNLNVGPPITNSAGSFPGRVGHSGQFQQSYNPHPLGRPRGFIVGNQHPNASGRPHVYDPFSPTCVSDQGSNISGANKQQSSDPEYEDLMASVGVK